MEKSLRLPAWGGKYYEIFGGPYHFKPGDHRGVKMAVEIDLPADISIPTHDFATPSVQHLYDGLDKTLTWLMRGNPVYVGCAFGRGRTGVFLSALVKLWGIPYPVAYVRVQYDSGAVETVSQHAFVDRLVFPVDLKFKVVLAKFRGWLPSESIRLTK